MSVIIAIGYSVEYLILINKRNMKVYEIDWDIDHDDLDLVLDLPVEVDVPDGTDIDDIADMLSDEYGFCINSFSVSD
jgi:hypothetical protein